MKLFGIIALIATSVGAGFGAQHIRDEVVNLENENEYYCHRDGGFGEYFFEGFSDEDRVLVETELNRLLEDSGLTLDDLYENHYVRHEIMDDLWNYIYENEIEFDDSGHHGHMRWR